MKSAFGGTVVPYITRAAVIAALYAALTLACAPIAYGPVQFRVSEALTVLPFFMPEAVPGLFIGCIAANFFSTAPALWDVIIGSAATLISALITYRIRVKWLAPLPAVIVNALLVGAMLAALYSGDSSFQAMFLFNAATVGAGEALVCYGLGLPLLLVLGRSPYFTGLRPHKKR